MCLMLASHIQDCCSGAPQAMQVAMGSGPSAPNSPKLTPSPLLQLTDFSSSQACSAQQQPPASL